MMIVSFFLLKKMNCQVEILATNISDQQESVLSNDL